MKKKSKIAVIGLKGLPAFGGAATVGENIIDQLKDKYDFTVYAISSHTDKLRQFEEFKLIMFKSFLIKKFNILYYYLASALHAVVRGDFDLVHLHHSDAAFIILILKLKYKVILTTHGIFRLNKKWERYSFYFKFQEKSFVKYADLITCVSLNELRLFKTYMNKDVIHIPNGIKIEEDVHKNKSEFLLFSANRIIHGKGLDILLKALNILNYRSEIIIAGDLNHTREYKNEILNLLKNLNANILGLIKDKKILKFYIKQAKYFIFPSSMEAMSMMLLEVASLKTPIICSDIIENKDIFNNTEVLFFQTDNENDLSKKLQWALKNEELMKAKAENAYNKLLRDYSWENISQKYDELYKHLLIQ